MARRRQSGPGDVVRQGLLARHRPRRNAFRIGAGGDPVTARLGAILGAMFIASGCATAAKWSDLAVHDARQIATAPLELDRDTLKMAGVAVGAVVLTAALDDDLRRVAQNNTGARASGLSETIGPFGGRYADRVIAGFLVAGLATKNDRAKAVAFDALVSTLVASKIVTPVLKQVAGRHRPNETDDAFEFDGGSSFPSNHATQAFAVASVIAAHYESRWVDGAAYGLATLVAGSRVYDDAHWASDVVAGALIGITTGRFVAATNQRRRATWTVVPIYDGERRGAAVSISLN